MSPVANSKFRKKMIPWAIALAICGVAIAAISTLRSANSLVYFYTPAEAVSQSGELSSQTIKVGGMIKPGSVEWIAKELRLNFVLTDLKGHEIGVMHTGSPPDLFKEGQGVVAEGRIYADGTKFESRRLMVKHSEEYKKSDDHSKMNQALLEDSIFKNEKNVNEKAASKESEQK